MNNRTLDIISFNIPYPPNYGGVIDVYYKLLSLKNEGYEIILHTFKYDREPSPALEEICKKVYYYKRKTGFFSFFHYLPYIVNSRRSSELLNNLNNEQGPILFEGLHSCYYLIHKSLRLRNKIVRTHNIEHKYYYHLYKAERNIYNKFFFLTEALKLKVYQKSLKKATSLATISKDDKDYFSSINKNSFLLHPFHSSSKLISQTGTGSYYLYHGNLEVPENRKAVWFLVANIFSKLNLKLVIAGKNPEASLKNYISGKSNIILTENPSEIEMQNLISDAQAIILYTLQSTGVKLKLLESLFKGRFCIVNDKIVKGTGLEELCIIANTPMEFISQIKKIEKQIFDDDILNHRKLVVEKFLPENNVSVLIEWLGKRDFGG